MCLNYITASTWDASHWDASNWNASYWYAEIGPRPSGKHLVGMTPCADMPHVPFCYVICILVDHHLLNVDNHYGSLIKYAIWVRFLTSVQMGVKLTEK